MEDLTYNGKDYTDLIRNTEDYESFKRLKWLEKNELHKPAHECIEAVVEAIRITDKLEGLPERKIIFQRPDMN